MDIREVLNRPEYDFIKTNPHLGGSMIFATFGGSHAYGTNTPDSDIDIRGCAFNSRTDILGRTNFEQVIDNPTDTTIYSFNKLIHLLSDCNPNTIELLGCKPEQYVFFNDIGRMMVEQRDMFLSQKAVHAFGGYATQQLRRLQAALARDRYDQSEKEKQILSSCKSSMTSFNDRYQEFENGAVNRNVDETLMGDLKLKEKYISAVNKGAMFDSRVFNIPKEDVVNYFVWRQQDSVRNSIQSAGQAIFSHKQLMNKSCDQIQDMLFVEKGINWNDYAIPCKRGTCCRKQMMEVECKNEPNKTVIRKKWIVDQEIPTFTQDMNYIHDIVMLKD